MSLDIKDAASMLFPKEPEGQTEEESEEVVPETIDDETEVEEVELEADDGETSEAETDEAEDSDEVEETDDEADDDDPLITITTKAGSEDVKFSELQNGYLREKDYTQKTQALANDRREFEAGKDQANAANEQLNQQLLDALATFAIDQDQEPDWANVDPAQYPKMRAEWENKGKQQQQAADMYRQLQSNQRAELIQREQALLYQAFPEWQDPTVFTQAADKMKATGAKYGFSLDEINGITDHRMFKILNDLEKMTETNDIQKINAAKVKKKLAKAAIKPAPGVKKTKSQSEGSAHRQKLDRFKKSRSLGDAAALLIKDA